MSDLLNKASLVMVPSGYKEDTVYSVVPSDGSGDLSFTRASNGTRINSAGLVEVCPWNLVQSSETFNLSPWNTNAGGSIISTTEIAPNGTLTADLLSATTSTSSGIYQVVTGNVVGQVYTASLYVKNNSGATSIKYQEENCAAGILFNSVTGAITSTFGTVINSSVESVGNGWYRIQFAYSSTSTTNVFIIYSTLGSANTFILWGAQLNIGSTAKPYFPTTDRLNVPRLTYQNGGGGCPSLLLEKQSTNLFTYSEQFDNAAWVKGLVSISANTITSPDGTQNADSIVDNTTNSRHLMEQPITGDLSISRAMSLYAKQNTLRYLYMSVTNAGDSHCYSAIFDLQNGTVSATKVNGSATINASIESAGNGWYRCTITGTMTSGTATFYPLIGTSDRGGFTGTLINNNAPSYAGSGQSLYIWGAQLEASSYPTSYIPTTSSSATRVADACYKTGISSLIGQTEGTIFVDTYVGNETDEVYGWLQASLSGNPNDSMQINRAGSSIQAQIYNGSTPTALITGGTISKGQRIKVAFAYKLNDCVLYLNGTQIGVDTSTAIPTCAVFQLGAYPPLPNDYTNDGGINQAVLFKTRLTNAELASLTTI